MVILDTLFGRPGISMQSTEVHQSVRNPDLDFSSNVCQRVRVCVRERVLFQSVKAATFVQKQQQQQQLQSLSGKELYCQNVPGC